MIVYNKLIRDKIPQIIESNGKKAKVRVLDDEDYVKMLYAKLQEELDEYASAANDQDQVEELADLVELVHAILKSKDVTVEEFEKIRLAKQEKRGGFKDRLYLVSVEEDDKEKIFQEYSSKEEQIARDIDAFIVSNFEEVRIKTPMTDCIGYKIGESKKFASLTVQDKHSLILHLGKKAHRKGIEMQDEIDSVLGENFPRTKTDNEKYPHQAFIKLDWIDNIEKIAPFITKAYELRKQCERDNG